MPTGILAQERIPLGAGIDQMKERRSPNPTFLIIGKLEKVSGGTCGLSASFGNIAA